MIEPAPTEPLAPGVARATLREVVPATATKPAHLRLAFANTSYVLYLLPTAPLRAEPGDKVLGTIQVRARRIDVVPSGGKYVEPVIGRPRRVQGRVLGHEQDRLIVDAGVPMHVTPTDERQRAQDFAPGQMVSFDALDGASFTPSDERD
ncbi:MAG: hypothetical protein KatS3mg103_1340 [Phycisphaerales bacterium]|nr:MAG: hypothetical protein KatS3mg103_1340 [Phycisphaerales bacterium]